jgi:anthranilate synthase component 1
MKKREFSADQLTPISAFASLSQKGSCLLESAFDKGEGRYSYIGIEPNALFTAKNGRIEMQIGTKTSSFEGDPYSALKNFHAQVKVPIDHPLAMFSGGVVGFIAYDAIRSKEKIPDRHPDHFQLPDFFFQSYRSSLVFDHAKGKALIIAETEEEIERLMEQLKNSPRLPVLGNRREASIETDLSDAEHCAMVEKAKEYLRAGDVFQIVLSRTFQAKIDAEPFQIYRSLRQVSPAPYHFFFDLSDYAIAGASPEKIISVQNRIIESTPIAGTCPKGGSIEKLLSDPKEIAEHVMLVDLARNDVGSVAVPGSVKVVEYKQPHPFSHVIHIVSRVTGDLSPQFDAIDAFKMSFPAGTLSGAPKVRAMELIDSLENSRRGLYGGAIVAMDAEGNLTSCIAIRTAFLKDGVAYVRAGGGLVLDSDPQKEADETRYKASAVLEALGVCP